MSDRTTRQLGVVSLVQLQPSGLIVDNPGPGPEAFYDVSRRVQVDRLKITPKGVEATLPGGERVLDIHHLDHPDKAYSDDDLVCVGFTAHYEAMRAQFGEHMVDGVAGENIIIDHPDEVWPQDLGQSLAIQNQDSGDLTILQMVSFAAPCVEFSRFCIQRPTDDVPTSELGETLRFLGNGRRGYLLVLDKDLDEVAVRPGDKVFLLDAAG